MVVVVITLATIVAFQSLLRAQQAGGAQEAPAASSTGTPHSVWDGIYTEEQAMRGETLYTRRCAACHGPDLNGGEIAPALASAEFKSNWNGLTVNDLFERIRVSMPQDNPGTLSRQQIADTLAFVFSKNGFPVGKMELARETEVVKEIRFEAIKP